MPKSISHDTPAALAFESFVGYDIRPGACKSHATGRSNPRGPGYATGGVEPRRHRWIYERLQSFANNRVRFGRYGDARLANRARSLQEKIHDPRTNGTTHIFR